jgi:small-conductance mechanosensitive channel
MLPFLMPLLAKHWKPLVLAVVVIGGFLWLRAHYKAEGKEEGKAEVTQQSAEAIEQMRAADRARLDETLSQFRAEMEEARERELEAVQLAGRNAKLAADLQARRAAVAENVARVPDSDLRRHIIKRLDVRDPQDQTAGYTPAEERTILRTIDEHTVLKEEASALRSQVGAIEQQVKAMSDQMGTMRGELRAVTEYSNRLEGYYAAAYNLIPKKKRSAKCIWLWQCGKKALAVPDPINLKAER